jgi:hypothetical protein
VSLKRCYLNLQCPTLLHMSSTNSIVNLYLPVNMFVILVGFRFLSGLWSGQISLSVWMWDFFWN